MIRFFHLIFGVVALLLYAASPGEVAAQSDEGASFEFKPPVGVEFVEIQKSIIQRKLDARQLAREERKLEYKCKFEEKSDGYLLNRTLVKATRRTDDFVIADPYIPLLKGHKFTYHINSDGKLESVEGYEELAESLPKFFSGKKLTSAFSILSPQIQFQRIKSAWENQVSSFIGKDVEEGKFWGYDSETRIGNSAVKLKVYTKFSNFRTKNGLRLVDIESYFNSTNPYIFTLLTGHGLNTPRSELLKMKVSPGYGYGYAGISKRTVDADTLTPYIEKTERKTVVPIRLRNGKRVSRERVEIKVTRFEYPWTKALKLKEKKEAAEKKALRAKQADENLGDKKFWDFSVRALRAAQDRVPIFKR